MAFLAPILLGNLGQPSAATGAGIGDQVRPSRPPLTATRCPALPHFPHFPRSCELASPLALSRFGTIGPQPPRMATPSHIPSKYSSGATSRATSLAIFAPVRPRPLHRATCKRSLRR